MSKQTILSVDLGTSSSRVLAVDERGNILASVSRPVTLSRPQEGRAEMDAQQWLQDVWALLDEMAAKTEGEITLSIASQRSTIVFWNRKTGEPLCPILSWQDGRAWQQTQAISLSQEEIHERTGLYKTPFYSAAKIKWALEQIPAVAHAAKENRLCIGPLASFLIWHLTAGRVFACDSTLAQRTLLFNIHTLDWDDTLLQHVGVQRSWLPQIKPTAADYGVWEHAGRSCTIRVCVGDQQAALYALQLVAGEACINYGTGAFYMYHTGAQCQLLPGVLTSVGASGVHENQAAYLLEGTVNACGSLFEWLRAQGFAFEMQELDALVAQAKQPVWLLPALGGLGAPYWDFTASPVVAGLSPHTRKSDWLAGAVAAIAYLIADIEFYLAKQGRKAASLKVSGGLSQLQVLLQKQADILQCPLHPCVEHEGSAMGAALLAAEIAQKPFASWKTISYLPQVSPHLSAGQAAQQYAQWQNFCHWARAYQIKNGK